MNPTKILPRYVAKPDDGITMAQAVHVHRMCLVVESYLLCLRMHGLRFAAMMVGKVLRL